MTRAPRTASVPVLAVPTLAVLTLAVLMLLAACATPTQTFLHRTHRLNFALQPAELEGVQFYISTEILARNEAEGDSPAGVVIVPVRTPGAALDVGESWLRVSFSEGGRGVYFVTVPEPGAESAYWLGTKLPGSGEIKRVKDLDDKVLHTDAGAFRVIRGDTARLMINSDQLEKLIEKRTHLKGRAPGSN